MDQAKIVLCDTDVIIALYRNNPDIVSQLKIIGQQNIAISTVTAGELIYAALNKEELNQIKKDIDNLILVDIDKKTCDIFLELLGRYAISHKLAVADGLIAATALSNGLVLYTLNLKDYRFIEGLKIYKKGSV